MYFYIKALHIIFVVTWFSGLFYMVRLFIYNTEAQSKPALEKEILSKQFKIMSQRLWNIITWPSAILTLIFGGWMWYLQEGTPSWLIPKLVFVLVLYLYHIWLHFIFLQQKRNVFRFSSQSLRLINEVSTVLLIAIVFMVELKNRMPYTKAIVFLIAAVVFIVLATKIYKQFRKS